MVPSNTVAVMDKRSYDNYTSGVLCFMLGTGLVFIAHSKPPVINSRTKYRVHTTHPKSFASA